MTLEPKTSPRATRFTGPLVVAATAVLMLCWSWETWPDPVVDFGRELYVPWRLSAGDVLYRDIVSYFNGPLSPYLHALLFKCFGVSLQTLVIFNLGVVTLLAALTYRMIAGMAGNLAATAAGVAFFVLFAFAQYLLTGNYNYICPYSYELPHGITLTAATIASLICWHQTQRRGWIAASGSLLGLVFLTKAEVFFAAALTSIAIVIASMWLRRRAGYRAAIDTITFLGCALAPVLFAFLLLLAAVEPLVALRGIAGSWRWIGDRQLLELPFFKELAGTSDIPASLGTIAIWAIGYATVFVPPVLIGLVLRNGRRSGNLAAVGVFVIICTLGFWKWERINWNNFIRPLPLVLGIFAAIAAVQLVRRKTDQLLPFALAVWGSAMLAKMPLNAHIYHYGFALAMPATLVGVALFVGVLPKAIERAGGNGAPFCSAALAVLLVALWAHGHVLDHFWSIKTYTVGHGDDAFRADMRGVVVNGALEELAHHDPTNRATLAVVPEGLMINYLSRRINPTGQLNFTPPAIVMYGEDQMLSAFRAHPPTYIMLTDVNTIEYGVRFFGMDYGKKLGAWMRENYMMLRVIAARPLDEQIFQIVLLRKSP